MKIYRTFKLITYTCFAVAWAFNTQAQGGGGTGAQTPPVQLPQIIQAAPEAANLGKFGDQQIGLNTGTAMARIPLYELRTKNLSLPISVSYSSNGVKVDEISSRVGMSWVLNAGGVITRTVYDKPDFATPRIAAPPSKNFHPFNASMSTARSSLFTSDQNLVTWLEYNVLNQVDMQYDEYNFNFGGYTGKFIFDDNGLPVLLPQSDLKIEYNSAGTPWSFKITTPDGTKYYFGGTATDISLAATGLTNHDEYSSAWYLNRIENASDPTDYITLEYGSSTYGFFSGVSETITIDPDNPPGTLPAPRTYSAATEINATITGLLIPNFTIANIGISGVYLQSITASHYGLVKFSYYTDPKPDVPGGGDHLLQRIEVDPISGQPALYFNFNYDIVAHNGNVNWQSDYYPSDRFSTAESLKRPFLKNVIKTSATDPTPQIYAFEYNSMNDLPPFLSFAQDHWGYYNGKTRLNSLIFPGEADYRLMGAALVNKLNVNRDVDYAFAQHGILTKITYPTGGSTQFSYEGNSGDGLTPPLPPGGDGSPTDPTVLVNSINLSSASTPSMSFEVRDVTNAGLTVNISCACPYGGTNCPILPSNTPAAQLVLNQTTNLATIDFSAFNARGDCARSSGGAYTLQPGAYGVGVIPHSPYNITVTLTNTGSTGGFWVPYHTIDGVPVIPPYVPLSGGFFGGLRVKSTTDTDPVTGVTKTINYTYSGMSGSYVPLYEVPLPRYGLGGLVALDPPAPPGAYTTPTFPLDYAVYQQFLSGTYSNLVGRNSHNVTYTSVTESYGTNFEGGGIDHTFSYNINNSALVTPYGGHNQFNISPPEFFWRNGLETSRSVFKMNNTVKVPVQTVTSTYTIDPRINNKYEQFNIKKNGGEIFACQYPDIHYTNDQFSIIGCSPAFFSDAFAFNKRESIFDVYSITNVQEWQYLSQKQTTTYDANGQNPVTLTTNYFYDNPAHLQLTRDVTTNSDGKVLTALTTYPDDYVSGTTFIDNMKTNHLTGLPVEKVSYQTVGGVNSIISGKVNQYLTGGLGLIDKIFILESSTPVPLSGFKFSNTVLGQLPAHGVGGAYALDSHYTGNPRVIFGPYNTSGDLLTVAMSAAPPVAYQWGYNNQYPVAKVTNALNKNIFYEGFEDGAGTSNPGDAKTGHYSKLTSYSKTLTGLDNGSYTLSYWKNTAGVWALIITPVSVTTGSYPISLSGQVDDLRFYPAAAQMTTYTYDPLVGMTSSTDAKGEITYYEYDAFQRLMNVRDKDGNIVNHTDYHYQQ